jgi:hypothetical protein
MPGDSDIGYIPLYETEAELSMYPAVLKWIDDDNIYYIGLVASTSPNASTMAVSDTWRMAIEWPDNMLELFDNAGDAGDLETAYDDSYPIGADIYSAPAGSNTHTGANHGGVSIGSTGATQLPANCLWKLFPNTLRIYGNSNHSHPISHSHSAGAVNHEPYYQSFLCSVVNGKLRSNALFFSLAGSPPSDWTDETAIYSDKCIKIDSGIAAGGTNGVHGHGSHSGNSGVRTFSTSTDTRAQTTWYTTHRHSINHTHSNHTATPKTRTIKMFRNDIDIITFADIPINTVAIFVGTDAPPGWTKQTGYDGRLLKIHATTETNAGVDNHSIGSQGFTTGGAANYSGATSAATTGTKNRIMNAAHTHSMTHGHLTGVSNLPRNTEMIIAKKVA